MSILTVEVKRLHGLFLSKGFNAQQKRQSMFSRKNGHLALGELDHPGKFTLYPFAQVVKEVEGAAEQAQLALGEIEPVQNTSSVRQPAS
jgi:hypothetical protein